jgi:EAL domain-containing protein (putative c-di-GMP-specific phosphodiesterase class I)
VCLQLARWTEAGFGHLEAWVNVSGLELASPRFSALVQRSLSAQRIDPSRLHLECTENVLLEASPSTIEHLRALADAGISVGIDDFGTGYSSLGYLRDLPVSFLKIDAAFTRRLDEPGGASMVEAMVGLGRSLGLKIVAEGVESLTQMESLAVIGCDMAQGHLFAHPGPIDTLVLSHDPGASWP